jgi:rubrerythrin
VTTVQQSFEKLISIAITREEEAYEFYMEASKQAELKSSAKLLEELAQQEVGHKKKLVAALDSDVCGTFACKNIEEFEEMDLSKYLLEIPLDPSSGPQDILIVAMKREESAYNFYKALSELTTSSSHRTVFETLASEEKGHKERLERMYDEYFQPDM